MGEISKRFHFLKRVEKKRRNTGPAQPVAGRALAGGHAVSLGTGSGALWHAALGARGYLGSGSKSAAAFWGRISESFSTYSKQRALPWVSVSGTCPVSAVMGAVLALGFVCLPIAWKPFQIPF